MASNNGEHFRKDNLIGSSKNWSGASPHKPHTNIVAALIRVIVTITLYFHFLEHTGVVGMFEF